MGINFSQYVEGEKLSISSSIVLSTMPLSTNSSADEMVSFEERLERLLEKLNIEVFRENLREKKSRKTSS